MLHRQYQYDPAGQLSGIRDLRRGALRYRYDPVGRLLEAHGALGSETFDFDPAGNLLDDSRTRVYEADPARGRPALDSRLSGPPRLVDNLLREYAGIHYKWDDRGNLTERLTNGAAERFAWDAFNRLVGYRNPCLSVQYRYDALGRRLVKSSSANVFGGADDGEIYRRNEQARLDRQYGCGFTVYGWDGDQLAWESRSGQVTHYLYEPGSFTPLAQAVRHAAIELHPQPAYAGDYDVDDDPLWTLEIAPQPFDALAWYQCDHLGTPQELTDETGDIAWSAQYKAWGAAREVISEAARKAGISNPLRFQGQYFDHETGLHYNRYRYYDPVSGRFVSRDPIGLRGGLNGYGYAPNPVGYVDPLGLAVEEGVSVFYHAGNLTGPIDLSEGRRKLDFNPSGKGGFYVTTDRGQAIEWAIDRGHSKITRFDIPNSELSKLDIKTFDSPGAEWADFVSRGRKGTLSHGYDGVSGPMVENPKAVRKGAPPKPKGCQLAIFSAGSAVIFDKYATEDCWRNG
ncbi:RHS repeat-associated core domain-containing protein [Cupriavidus campinensis]